MYENPIEVIMKELPARVIKEEENIVAMEIRKQISVTVNEIELKRALAYDRDQYDKGFRDARNQFERPHGEWIPRDVYEAFNECSNCGMVIDNDFPIWRNFCPRCGADMRKENQDEE